MKWLVWILLILNFTLLGFFIASSYVADPAPEPVAAVPDNSPIKVLSPEELAAMPKKVPPPPTPAPAPAPVAAPVEVVQTVCYEWGSFNAADAEKTAVALKHQGLQATPQKQAHGTPSRYWVYLPPQKSMAAAEAKVAELHTLGIKDSFIVQDQKMRYAISLGVFKDENLASTYLQKLRDIGIKNAVKADRDNGNTQTTYLIRNLSPTEVGKLNTLKSHFSGSELNPIDCR